MSVHASQEDAAAIAVRAVRDWLPSRALGLRRKRRYTVCVERRSGGPTLLLQLPREQGGAAGAVECVAELARVAVPVTAGRHPVIRRYTFT